MIRLGALGDVVRTLPAVSSLRAGYAGADITWLVEPRAAGAVQGQPWVDDVLVFPRDELQRGLARRRLADVARRAAGFARMLRRRRFDLVLDFHAIARSALLARASAAPRRVSYARPFGRELAWLAATDLVKLPPARISRFERNQALVRHLGVSQAPAPRPFAVSDAAAARAAAQLGGTAVAIHAGSSDATSAKRVPVEVWARAARQLRARHGLTGVATWGPARDDRRAAEALVAAADGAVRLAPPTPAVSELAALLAGCRLFLGADTGPLHIASLVGTPVVQAIGPTDRIENTPWSDTPWRRVEAPGRDLAGVAPAEIVDAARALLVEAEERPLPLQRGAA